MADSEPGADASSNLSRGFTSYSGTIATEVSEKMALRVKEMAHERENIRMLMIYMQEQKGVELGMELEQA